MPMTSRANLLTSKQPGVERWRLSDTYLETREFKIRDLIDIQPAFRGYPHAEPPHNN